MAGAVRQLEPEIGWRPVAGVAVVHGSAATSAASSVEAAAETEAALETLVDCDLFTSAVRGALPRESGPFPGVSDGVEEHTTIIGGYPMHSLQVGSGRPLILLHGLLGAAVCWRPAMQFLARQARVYAARIYAVDALGIGLSTRVPGIDASLGASADRLRSFMDNEGIKQADLCATSHGGAVAMCFAARYPERVRSLILQAPANPFCSRSRPQIRLFCSRTGQWLGRRIPYAPQMLQAFALKRMYGDPARLRPGSLEDYVRSLQVPGTVDYILSVLRCWTDDMVSLKRQLKRLRGLPCLLLWGTEDRAVSVASGEALRKVLGAQIDVLPGVGHLPYEEQPQEFAERVMRFLCSLDPSRVASVDLVPGS